MRRKGTTCTGTADTGSRCGKPGAVSEQCLSQGAARVLWATLVMAALRKHSDVRQRTRGRTESKARARTTPEERLEGGRGALPARGWLSGRCTEAPGLRAKQEQEERSRVGCADKTRPSETQSSPHRRVYEQSRPDWAGEKPVDADRSEHSPSSTGWDQRRSRDVRGGRGGWGC